MCGDFVYSADEGKLPYYHTQYGKPTRIMDTAGEDNGGALDTRRKGAVEEDMEKDFTVRKPPKPELAKKFSRDNVHIKVTIPNRGSFEPIDPEKAGFI